MKLWMWYAPGTDAQITAACEAAQQELNRRGIDIFRAFQATLAASELPEDHQDGMKDVPGVEGWYAAEFAAFEHLANACGEWPANSTLIVVQ